MTTQKPIREQDQILLRVPDGLKGRIAARAKANHRSLSGEVVAMLLLVMDEPTNRELRDLEDEYLALEEDSIQLAARLTDVTQRKLRAGEALRQYMRRQADPNE